LGQLSGELSHTLLTSEMAAHPHTLQGASAPADNNRSVTNNLLGSSSTVSLYATASPTTTLNQATVGLAGGGQPHNNVQPLLVLNSVIALVGTFPPQSCPLPSEGTPRAEPFLGEIKMFGGNFAIRGWAFCDGQLMAISQNDALFALFGTIYGGDGQSTFGLPD